MEMYLLAQTMECLTRPAEAEEKILVLLDSEELARPQGLAELPDVLRHTPLARDARVCKAEAHRGFLCGTVHTPRKTREGTAIAFGYLISGSCLALCDDSGAIRTAVRRMREEKRWTENGPGYFFCQLLEWLLARDPHHMEELESRLGQLEDQALSGVLHSFSAPLTALRNEAMGWYRYYAQLGEMVCELEEDAEGLCSQAERRLFHILEQRLGRLRDEAQLLREHCLQVRELFQSEVDLRQNRIMQILTVVTTLCLPLSLVAGWYGMNFQGMPELRWRYGYPAIIAISLLIVGVSLWIMKKKKFW